MEASQKRDASANDRPAAQPRREAIAEKGPASKVAATADDGKDRLPA